MQGTCTSFTVAAFVTLGVKDPGISSARAYILMLAPSGGSAHYVGWNPFSGVIEMFVKRLGIMKNIRNDRGIAFMDFEAPTRGLIGIRNVPADQIQPLLLAEAPRLLFPFARRVVADTVRDGNFPPLMLEPIDFGALYIAQAEQAAAAAGEPVGQA